MKPMMQPLAARACILTVCTAQAQKAEMPTPQDFKVGDTWEWRQIDSRTQLEEGKRSRTVVNDEGVLKFASHTGEQSQIASAFLGQPAAKPWRVWPLELGKKWEHEYEWKRVSDGVTIHKEQTAEVVAYEEVSVPAGKFMAFKIEYQGWYRNSKGSNGKIQETYWFAPAAKTDVKYRIDDGYNQYIRELVRYQPAPQ